MTTEQKIIDQGRIGGYVPPITDPEPEPDAIGSHAQPVDKEAQDSAKAEVLAEIHADEDERAETRDDLRARLKATPLTDLRKLSRGRFSGGYNMKKAELVERLMDCEHDA